MQQINAICNNNCRKYCNVYRKLPDNYDLPYFFKVQESFHFSHDATIFQTFPLLVRQYSEK